MPRYKNQRQRGGRVAMPMQYYNPNAKVPAYYPTGSPELTPQANAYGPTVAVSHGVGSGNAFPNSVGPNLAPAPRSSGLHTGGAYADPFDRITNPTTGRKVSIYSKKGKEVLSNYVNAYRNLNSYY